MPEPAEPMSCRVCGARVTEYFAEARDWEYRTSDEYFRYDRCTVCGSVMMNPPPVDRIGEIYPANYYSYAPDPDREGFGEKVKRRLDERLFRKVLAQLKGDDLSVLDVGGGTGRLLGVIRNVSPRVAATHVIDLDANARDVAEASGHVFHHGPVEHFECNSRFDLILLLNLIEHVADPLAVLSSMFNVLRPGGLMLVKTPNVDTIDMKLFRHRNWGGYHCPRHFVLFNREALRNVAQVCGFEVMRLRYTQGSTQWASSVMANLAAKGVVSITRERPMIHHPLFAPLSILFAGVDFVRMPLMATAQMLGVFRRPT